METERITTKKENYSVNVAAGKVESLRKITTSFTAVRAYDKNCIGVAGQIGAPDIAALEEQAKQALTRRIPYPCRMTGERKSVRATREIIAPEKFVETCTDLMQAIRERLPDFTAGNKINLDRTVTTYTNSLGGELVYDGNNLFTVLTFKEKQSANIQDFGYISVANSFDFDKTVRDCGTMGDAFKKRIPLPEKKLPVILDSDSVQRMLIGDMIAENYCAGAGKLAGKLNTKVFSDKLTVAIQRDMNKHENIKFFDDEGTLDGGFKLVDAGVFSGLITNKRSAAMFNLPLSASAGTESFDSVPSYSLEGFATLPTHKRVTDITADGIYVAISSGGDVAPDGTVGLPVQLAYLVEGGKLVGRLPELSITANVFDLLGSAYLGTAQNSLFETSFGFHDVFDVAVAVRK